MKPLLPVLALGLSAFTAPALAGPATVSLPVEVRYDPAAPADEIYSDLERAARQACRMRSPALFAMARAKAERDCRRGFVADAVAAIAMPDLAALHEAETGERARALRFSRR